MLNYQLSLGLVLLLATVLTCSVFSQIFRHFGYSVSSIDEWTNVPARITGFWVSLFLSVMMSVAIGVTFSGLLHLGGF